MTGKAGKRAGRSLPQTPVAAPSDRMSPPSLPPLPPLAGLPSGVLTPETRRSLHQALVTWFGSARRSLPWRMPLSAQDAELTSASSPSPVPARDPYAVWVSEIMLQQTQVVTVIPYFLRFMERFPTVDALAEAPLEDVLSLWRGLGYYARARNLHRGAAFVHQTHGGQLPSELEAILAVPGIGRYTAGAILSLAYDRPVSLLDGNVARVLARVLGVTLDPKLPAGQKAFWALADALVPGGALAASDSVSAGDWNEALMELGALVCTPSQPQCPTCPLHQQCYAASLPDPTVLPTRGESKTRPDVHAVAVVLRLDDRLLMFQRPPDGLLGGLWELPGRVVDPLEPLAEAVPRIATLKLGLAADALQTCGPSVEVEHIFTHLRLMLRVVPVTLNHTARLPLASLQSLLNLQLEGLREQASPDRSQRGRGIHAVEVPWLDFRWVDAEGLKVLPIGKATLKALEQLEKGPVPEPASSPQLKLF